MKILFLCLRLQDSGLEILPTFSCYFQGLHAGHFFLQRPRKPPIIAQCHLCLEMLQGEGLITYKHSKNMGF